MDAHDPIIDRLPFILRTLISEGIIPETMAVMPGRVDFVLGLGVGVSIRLPLVDEEPSPVEFANEHSALELVILGTLRGADKPLKGETVACRCGRKFGGRFRETLSGLIKNGQIRNDGEGYVLSVPDHVPDHVPNVPEDVPNVPDHVPDHVPEDVSDDLPET